MSLFEFMLVVVAMLIAIALGRLLEALYDAILSANREPLAIGWLAVKISNCLMYIAASWAIREDFVWGLAPFASSVAPALVLTLQAYCLATPTPRAVVDWRAHYEAVRRPFFFLNILFGASLVLASFGALSGSAIIGLTFRVVIVVLSVVAFATPRRSAQILALATAVVLQLLGFAGISAAL